MNARIQIVSALMLALCMIALPVTHARKPPSPKKMGKSPLPSVNTAHVVDLFGRVGKKAAGAGEFTSFSTGSTLTAKTTVRTGDASAVLILLPDGLFLRVGEKTVVVLNELVKEGKFSFRLLSGQVWVAMHDSRTVCEVQTPSSATKVVGNRANSPRRPTLFGVGYELEVDQSMVSVANGKSDVSSPGAEWRAFVQSGQYVRYLRNPQPNIRLRAPEVLAQDVAQKQMWELLRTENWTKPDPSGNNGAKLKRGQEKQLRQLTFSVSVDQ